MSGVTRFHAMAVLVLVAAGPAASQSVVGRVLDEVSDTALPATSVMLPLPGSFGSTVTFRGFARWCPHPRFVLNGWLLALGGFSVDELVHPEEIMAIEVYPSGAGAPPRYLGFGGARCGVVMIWTY